MGNTSPLLGSICLAWIECMVLGCVAVDKVAEVVGPEVPA